MTLTIHTFDWVPDFPRGFVRDIRARWVAEEVGLPYQVATVPLQPRTEAHRALQPFGQVPMISDGDLALFESGAIVLHIAETRSGLLPADRAARARAVAWIFAAIDTVEPPVFDLDLADILDRDRPWHAERRPILVERVRRRLGDLSEYLGGQDWLEGEFTAGDLMMVTVLRRLQGSELLGAHPSLSAYVARAEARPAFGQALAEQKAVWSAGRDAGP